MATLVSPFVRTGGVGALRPVQGGVIVAWLDILAFDRSRGDEQRNREMIETMGERDERQALGKDNRTPFPRHATTTAHQPTPFHFSASHEPLPTRDPGIGHPPSVSLSRAPSE